MVWLEQINKKLVLSLRDTIQVTDSEGVLQPVRTSYARPEGEGNEDASILPAISVKLVDLGLDLQRVGANQGLKLRVAETPDTVTLKNYPLPYKLFYEINLEAEFQSDLPAMITQVLTLFPPRGVLMVADDDGEETPLIMEMADFHLPSRVNPEVRIEKDSVERKVRNTLRYILTAELDESDALAATYPKVKEAVQEINKMQVVT